MATKRKFELALRESGTWAIVPAIGSKAAFVMQDTGHVDKALAAQDLASFTEFGSLSTIGQAWTRTAERLAQANRTRRHKRQRQDDVLLTRVDVLRLLQEQGYTCPLSGSYFEPDPEGNSPASPYQPSLDRIDASAGYKPGNVRIVCLLINLAMNRWGEEPLRKIAERIVARGSRPDGSSYNSAPRPRLRLLPLQGNGLVAPGADGSTVSCRLPDTSASYSVGRSHRDAAADAVGQNGTDVAPDPGANAPITPGEVTRPTSC